MGDAQQVCHGLRAPGGALLGPGGLVFHCGQVQHAGQPEELSQLGRVHGAVPVGAGGRHSSFWLQPVGGGFVVRGARGGLRGNRQPGCLLCLPLVQTARPFRPVRDDLHPPDVLLPPAGECRERLEDCSVPEGHRGGVAGPAADGQRGERRLLQAHVFQRGGGPARAEEVEEAGQSPEVHDLRPQSGPVGRGHVRRLGLAPLPRLGRRPQCAQAREGPGRGQGEALARILELGAGGSGH
mmetsp:Transcript_33129/g.103326  ORF Transcript_33129/g.103326 Transcript_33129/m.103326 type:complete len:239 (-) Transcript_33129:142-858(-)